MKKTIKAYFPLLLMALLMACSNDDDSIVIRPPISLSEDVVELEPTGRYYSVFATIPSGVKGVSVECDAPEWLWLDADTVAHDGMIEFYADDNTGASGRTAVLTIMSNGQSAATIKVHQAGLADTARVENGEAAAYKKFMLGYGYNIFKDYMSTKSSTKQVIDYSNAESSMQMALYGKEEVEHITANTLYQMAEIMTRKQEKSSSGVCGSKNTKTRFEQNGKITIDEAWFTYIRLKRTSAVSAIDFGQLQYLMGQGMDVFTPDFRKAYNEIISNQSDKSIDDMLKDFGTHLIVSSELGGSMDVTISFRRNMSGDLNQRAEDFSGYFLKNEAKTFNDNDVLTNIDSNEKGTSAYTIVGGSEATRKAIVDGINGTNKRISPADLLSWQNTLNLNGISDIVSHDGLVPVNFQTIPIWQLFPQNLHGKILAGVLRTAAASGNDALSDFKTQTDLYAIPLKKDDKTDIDFMKFNNGADATLVRVLYASHQESGQLMPTLEICNEYVPAIRGDRRINVVYAIRNGRTFHGAGLFPGDGEGNPPAWLTFSDGEVYVNPIEGKSAYETIDTVYYLHGNIYETDLGIHPPVAKRQSVNDQMLKFYSTTYPIVKIGSGYWTRSCMSVDMKYSHQKFNNNGILYANYLQENNSGDRQTFFAWYGKFYGDDEDKTTQMRTKWWLPRSEDLQNLQTYIGHNTKALFKEQVSGFDADFNGCYTRYDPRTNKEIGTSMAFHFNNAEEGYLCFIPSRDNDKTAYALVLSPDYHLQSCEIQSTQYSYFTLRLFRTSYFSYL